MQGFSSSSPETAQLGALRKRFGLNWFSIIGLLFLVAFFAFVPIYDMSVGSFGVFDAVCGSLALLPLLYGAFLVSRWAGSSVDVHEAGFVFRNPGKNISVGWDDIETLWVDVLEQEYQIYVIPVMLRLRYRLRFRLRDGREFVIPGHFGRVKELGNWIVTETVRQMYPKALARLEQGGEIEFGKYRINKDALVVEGKPFAWERRPQLGLLSGHVMLTAKGDVGNALKSMIANNPMKDIPNLFLLMALIHHYVNEPEEMARS